MTAPNLRRARATQNLVAAALIVLAAGCDFPDSATDSAADAGTVAPLGGAPGAARLSGLPIAQEDTGAHYNRDDWPHWREQGDGCDTRQLVLRQQGHAVQAGTDCSILTGEWVSPYDGVTVTDPSDLDVDHVVPLAEVTRSGRIVDGRRVGPRTWSREQRERYANDLGVLVAVTATSNRRKGDDDPARWLPDRDQCGYVARWIEIKTRYDLSADPAEHDALAAVLTGCQDTASRPGGGGDQ